MAAARAIWSGSISFGLVNIPVKMHTAVREDRISFHMLHDQDKVRLQRKMVCPEDGKEVHPEHTVKGYEIAKGQYVIIQQDELEGCSPEKTRSIEITDFVELAQIDPIYFDRAYYLTPAEHAARPYRLLLEAMKRSGRVGIARIVMHDKEYLAALRTKGDALCLSTMHFGNEVVPVDQLGDLPTDAVGDKELKAADQLIQSLLTDFDPSKYHDEYKTCVMAMIEKKANGEQIVMEHAAHPKQTGKAPDLMAALQASLAKAKAKADGSTNGHARASRSANGAAVAAIKSNGRVNGHSNGHSNGNGNGGGHASATHRRKKSA